MVVVLVRIAHVLSLETLVEFGWRRGTIISVSVLRGLGSLTATTATVLTAAILLRGSFSVHSYELYDQLSGKLFITYKMKNIYSK